MVWLPRWGCDGMITSAQKLLMARAGVVPVDRSWDVSYASYSGTSFDVTGQESSPTAAFFKPDGTKMYVCGTSGDDVNEYDISTAWDVSTASYVQNFSVALQESNPAGLFFKPDGTKMYVCGFSSDSVHEYDLSTAWDVSTASFLQTFSVSAQANPTGIFFKPDGTKMYVCDNVGDDIDEFSLSSAWDISSASYSTSISVSARDAQPQGVSFKADGTKMYFTGTTSDAVNEYDLSTAWDVSSAVYSQAFFVGAQSFAPNDVFFRSDGLAFFITGNGNVFAYDIG